MGILLFVGVAIFLIIIGDLNYRFEKVRTQKMESIAKSLGFSFSLVAPIELENKIKIFKLFEKGHSKKSKIFF
jgi:hypothetical protein